MYYEQHYQTHVRTFDSVEDLISSCQAVRESATKNVNPFDRLEWVGRSFDSWREVYSAARSPWDDGRQIVERHLATGIRQPGADSCAGRIASA